MSESDKAKHRASKDPKELLNLQPEEEL